ncbi:MAG: hypothetical protein A2070_01500 [Bdellovibrionales bacterium GWC1_52_8]|nr:MAG: hypothetical protein A2Z97_09205 [Bdellovibrionales bacterium GWB1_52_6]OFZ05418.1 MAG: hypothetical protein A2X97_11090 [Bdellovibrionales bacterium GWA1_52_35]OFZ41440.1 MAG: hypothetical protein A2070_01500 [Bdellovibrionales bacterium GWC1_52_8]
MTFGKCAVLVVEDDATLRSILEEELTRSGYQVSTAPDGELGLLKFIEQAHDLIITDYNMPGMNGATLIKYLKRVDHYLPVLITTGMTQPDLLVDFLKFPNLLILPKPFTDETLHEGIRSVMANRRTWGKQHRRKHLRIPLTLPADTNAHGPIQIRNLGLSGLAARVTNPIPVGTQLDIKLPIEENSIQIKAQAVWSRGHECGMAFKDLSENDVSTLKHWFFRIVSNSPNLSP